MATASKKKPAKKAAKKRPAGSVKPDAVVQIPVNPDPPSWEQVLAEREQFGERWYEAWRLRKIGVPVRAVAEKMGVSTTLVQSYVARHELVIAGDPVHADAKNGLLATLEHAEAKMMAELAQLEAKERAKPADEREPVWLEHGEPLFRVLDRKARLLGVDQGKKQKVTIGVAGQAGSGGGMPDAVAQLVATVTVEDS